MTTLHKLSLSDSNVCKSNYRGPFANCQNRFLSAECEHCYMPINSIKQFECFHATPRLGLNIIKCSLISNISFIFYIIYLQYLSGQLKQTLYFTNESITYSAVFVRTKRQQYISISTCRLFHSYTRSIQLILFKPISA